MYVSSARRLPTVKTMDYVYQPLNYAANATRQRDTNVDRKMQCTLPLYTPRTHNVQKQLRPTRELIKIKG